MLRHRSKGGIELASATTDGLGTQAKPFPFSRSIQALKETTVYLICICHRFVIIIEKKRKFRRFTKSLTVLADECLSIHIFFRISCFVPHQAALLNRIQVHLCHKVSSGPCLWRDSHHLLSSTCSRNTAIPMSRLTVYPQYGARLRPMGK